MPKVQRSRSIAIAALVAVTALALASAAALAATKTVNIVDTNGTFSFRPGTVTVTVGDTVEWNNTTGAPHTVTSDDSGPLDGGSNHSFRFDTAGSYAYHCEFHPSMHGTVVVEAAPGGGGGGGGGGESPPPTDVVQPGGSTGGQAPLPLVLGLLAIAIAAALLAARRFSAVRVTRD